MKYAVYYQWIEDDIEDAFNVENAKERDFCIKDMLLREEFKNITYCPIYASGEYGKLKEVN